MKKIQSSIHILASVDRVWKTLVDFPSHAQWNPLFASIQGQAQVGETLEVAARKADGQAGFVFHPTIIESKPKERLCWRGSLFFKGLFDGLHSFELRALTPQRTELIHQESFSGILVPFMGPLLRKTKVGFEQFNRALSKQVLKTDSLAR